MTIVDLKGGVRFRSGNDAEILNSFAVDWEASVGPILSTQSALANADILELIDLSALPINAVAIIRFGWVAFNNGAAGGCNLASFGTQLITRDKNGALHGDINANAFQANAVGVDPIVGLTAVTTPDANTCRFKVTNGNNPTAWNFRYSVSFVADSAVLNP